MPRPGRSLAVTATLAALALAGCGQSPGTSGFPTAATKNTTRVDSRDAASVAAAVARAVYSGRSAVTRPRVVVLVDRSDWRAATAAALLMSAPLRAPVLLSDGAELPDVTRDALEKLAPLGARQQGRIQVVRVGRAPAPEGLRSKQLVADGAEALAGKIDAFHAAANNRTSERVVVVSSERPEFALPAAAWAAKSGDPVFFVKRRTLPNETRLAIAKHQQPRIYVLGPPSVIDERVLDQLRRLGTVTRIAGPSAVSNAIAFAKFSDGAFGWGIVDPGHGLVFANPRHPVLAAVAAPLSASGKYGPLLMLDDRGELPRVLERYLFGIQPGYEGDPVRGVYNHAWLIGDSSAIPLDAQSRIDALLEIVPVGERLVVR